MLVNDVFGENKSIKGSFKVARQLSGHLTKPSAPVRPLPDTLKVTSASQCSKMTLFLVHTEPL